MISRKPHVIGKPFPLIEAQRKLTGVSCYAGDEELPPDTLHARILFSERPNARFQLRNVDEARNYPGVAALLTGKDLATRLGYSIEDRELLATSQTLYAGQALAIVAAETPAAAAAALALIQVEYEDLPRVLSIEEALAPDAIQVHPDFRTYVGADRLDAMPERNIAHTLTFSRGNAAEAFADADVILERTYTAAHLQHAPLETHGGIAQLQEDGELIMWLHIQAPFLQRKMISKALRLDPARVRIITGCVGGSFGGKVFVSIEGLLAAIALHVDGRPVKLLLNREEEFKGVFISPAMRARIKMGATKDGRIVAMQAAYDWNVGSSVDADLFNMQATTLAGTGPYAIPNAEIATRAIYTHLPPTAPLRGLSVAQEHWAIEQHIDELAEMLGLSSFEIRERNLVKGGDRLFPHFTMHASGLDTCARQVASAIDWQPTAADAGEEDASGPTGRGQGLAIGWSPIIFADECGSRVIIHCDADRICDVIVDGVDTGQGLFAFVTQLISFELNMPMEWVRVLPTDTGNYDPHWLATYHNLLWSVGHALLKATAELKHQILSYVSESWQEPLTNLDIVEGDVISYATKRRLSLVTLLREGAREGDTPPVFEVTATYRPPHTEDGSIDSWLQFFTATAYAVDVEVDERTGDLTILQMAAAADVGHALNPESVRAQIKGGMIQSVSISLLEEMIFEEGIPISLNFSDYPIATTADMPRKLFPIVVEVPQQSGPYGARDLSHHVQVGAAAAIGNAVYRAAGVRIYDLPITAQRIYDALQAKRRAEAD